METNCNHPDANLLAEIRDLLEVQNRKSKERTVLLFIGVLLLVGMFLVLSFGLANIIPRATASLDAIDAAVETIDATVSAIDAEQIRSLIGETEQFAKNSGIMMEQAETVLEGVASVDFDSLNGALKDLEAAVDNFASLDMSTLNRAIENLNETIEPLANFLKRFK